MSDPTTSDQLLAMTARWTAGVRALESERPDRLFNDPWAAALAGPEGAAWAAGRPPDSLVPIVIRTRFFDDFLQETVRKYDLRQVVLLAAGLDTRPFRLAWPAGTRWFELDQPAVLQYKEAVLQAAGAQLTCQRQTVALDLTTPWQEALLAAGFQAGQPACWLLEGFLFYLASPQIVRVLDELNGLAAPASWLGCDVANSLVLTSPWTRAWIEMQAQAGAPWLGTLDAPRDFFGQRGWQAALTQAGAPDAHFGRWTLPVIPADIPNMPHNWYVTAQKG